MLPVPAIWFSVNKRKTKVRDIGSLTKDTGKSEYPHIGNWTWSLPVTLCKISLKCIHSLEAFKTQQNSSWHLFWLRIDVQITEVAQKNLQIPYKTLLRKISWTHVFKKKYKWTKSIYKYSMSTAIRKHKFPLTLLGVDTINNPQVLVRTPDTGSCEICWWECESAGHIDWSRGMTWPCQCTRLGWAQKAEWSSLLTALRKREKHFIPWLRNCFSFYLTAWSFRNQGEDLKSWWPWTE